MASGFWDLVIDRISRTLDGWKKTFLSLEGIITLIQSCLSYIPCYFLLLFKILASVASKIVKLQRDFLQWRTGDCKKDHLISWDIVHRIKESGGLELGKIVLRNHALLGKWLWRLPKESSTLWY